MLMGENQKGHYNGWRPRHIVSQRKIEAAVSKFVQMPRGIEKWPKLLQGRGVLSTLNSVMGERVLLDDDNGILEEDISD